MFGGLKRKLGRRVAKKLGVEWAEAELDLLEKGKGHPIMQNIFDWLHEHKGPLSSLFVMVYGALYFGGPTDAVWDDKALMALNLFVGAGLGAGFISSDAEAKVKNMRKRGKGTRKDDPRIP